MNLRSLSDKSLLENTEKLAKKERELTLEVLHHFREVERRSLYATLSYSSLFEYAVNELKYSAGSAQRRISSMRLLKELPVLEKKIEEGTLNLSALAQAQSFFRQEKLSENTQVKNTDDKMEVLKSLENKSTREVERILVSKASEPQKLIPEKLRAVSDTHTEVKFLAEEELLKEIEELRALLSHKLPGASVKEILAYAVKSTVKNLKPKEPKVVTSVTAQKRDTVPKALPAPKLNPEKPSRYIPVETKRLVWKRDSGQCTYTFNNKRCCSKHGLEFDHIQPFALGGKSTPDNLRIRCKAHNQLAAVNSYGNKKIAQFIPRML